MCFHQIKIRLARRGSEVGRSKSKNERAHMRRYCGKISAFIWKFIRRYCCLYVWMTASNNILFLVALPSSSSSSFYYYCHSVKGWRLIWTNGLLRYLQMLMLTTRTVCIRMKTKHTIGHGLRWTRRHGHCFIILLKQEYNRCVYRLAISMIGSKIRIFIRNQIWFDVVHSEIGT